MKINTKFNLKDRVYIKELKIWGQIMDIFYNGNIEYNVRYFNNFEARTLYFLEQELSLDDGENKEVGFSKC